MKKISILFLVLLVAANLFAQQINKKYVLIEIFTETSCYYCPGAQLAADDFVAGGYNVAIAAYHYGDAFSTNETESRFSYYSIPGTPTAEFNGEYEKVGGDHNNSIFTYWEPSYNSAVDDLTSFDLSIVIESLNDINFNAHIHIEKVADYSNDILALHLVLTETNIDYSWQGLPQVKYAVRDMVPNQNGILLDFSDTNVIDTTLSFTIDDNWNLENMAAIAFLQDNSSKEILQVDQDSLELPIGENNVIFSKFIYPVDTVMDGSPFSPIVRIKNKGSDSLTSLVIKYWINDGDTMVYNWSGEVPSLEYFNVELPEITYDLQDTNRIYVLLEKPNDTIDDAPYNNFGSYFFTAPKKTSTPLYLSMNTGSWGFEISYLLEDINGDTVRYFKASSGPLIVKDTFDLELFKTYKFHLFDSYGNGFNSDDGYCTIYTPVETLFNVSGDFGFEYVYIFTPVEVITKENSLAFKSLLIYPNPAKDFIIVENDYDDAHLFIYSVDGKLILDKKLAQKKNKIDLTALPVGTYILKLKTQNDVITEKFIKE